MLKRLEVKVYLLNIGGVHLRADDRGHDPRDCEKDVGAEGNETGGEGDQIGEDELDWRAVDSD